ncbi:YceI family protein [Cognatitamlana onchidii]|uniref:YceI family protein n=1 Tax=Cognatitamlana onchidii TaxID=2562860 RepID=UPI0010A6148B|nr:YceI family protein [Algibacter onchidii]
MKTKGIFFNKLTICLLAIAFTFSNAQGQVLQLENDASSLTVFGTSNLHGWKIDAQTQQGTIRFNNLQTCEIAHLSLTVLTEGLTGVKPGITETVSETLKSNEYKFILFTLSEVTNIKDIGNGIFELKAMGDLIIAGTKKEVPIAFNVSIANNKVKLQGKATLKMTAFNLTPPEALMGTIQAKDDIVLRFDTSFVQSTIL